MKDIITIQESEFHDLQIYAGRGEIVYTLSCYHGVHNYMEYENIQLIYHPNKQFETMTKIRNINNIFITSLLTFFEVIHFQKYITCLRNENRTYTLLRNGNGVCTLLIRPVKPHNT